MERNSKASTAIDGEIQEPAENGTKNPEVEMEIAEEKEEEPSVKCVSLRNHWSSCTRPCRVETHPLPPSASLPRRFADNFLCPPHSRMGAIFFVIFITASGWATLFSMTGDEALPGGNLFALLVLFMACWCGGYLVGLVRLPPLLGMLLVGGVLGNVPHINVGKDIIPEWSSACRQIALTIILLRAGLGLDPKALRRLSFVVVRLAFLPCLTETLVDGIAAHLILGFPWQWGFMLGFVIAAVSPAVVVPSLLNLAERGYGLDKGIPTLVIAAASVDDVLAITGFGVMLGISFSSGNIVWTLFKGPVEAIVGVIYGIVGGIILWYIPQRKSKHLLLFRSSLMLSLGLMAIFGSKKLEWAGAGPLAVLTLSFVAAFKWRSEFKEGEKNPVEDVVGVLWMIFQPLLFGLIGAEVDVSTLDGDVVGLGIAVLAVGLTARIAVSFLAVLRTDLNLKEKLFIPFAWLPKATVQAAIGAVALDFAKEKGDDDLIELGRKVLMMAVLVILITAPLGAIGIAITGPRLLKHTPRTHTMEVKTPNGAGGHEDEDEKDKEDEDKLLAGERV